MKYGEKNKKVLLASSKSLEEDVRKKVTKKFLKIRKL